MTLARSGPLAMAVVVVALASACAPTTGALSVVVSDPGGVSAVIHIAGPDGYSQDLAGTQTLTGLAPGEYTVTPGIGRSQGTIVVELFDSSGGGPATVEAGETAELTVTFSLRLGSGRLWLGSNVEEIVSFGFAELSVSGSPDGNTLKSTGLYEPTQVAFDAVGMMWAVDRAIDGLFAYRPDQLGGGTLTPEAHFMSTDNTLEGAVGIAFDHDSHLWIASPDIVARYTPAQLPLGGGMTAADVTADLVLTSNGTSLSGPTYPTFDASGNLWLSCTGSNTLEMYTPAQLTSAGPVTPTVTIGGSHIDAPWQIAFDASGNLWVGAYHDSELLMYGAGQLSASGTPPPEVIITSPHFDGITGLAFDASGNLWVSSNSLNRVVVLTPSQLAASGSPTPGIVLNQAVNGIPNSPAGLTFYGAPAGYPLAP